MGVDTTIISQGANLLQGGPINAPGDEKNWKKKGKKKVFNWVAPRSEFTFRVAAHCYVV